MLIGHAYNLGRFFRCESKTNRLDNLWMVRKDTHSLFGSKLSHFKWTE
jgi:hypothetical protein